MLPTDSPHMSPTLDGTCTTDAATLVCAAGVCDVNDNECGFANGDGPCTDANGASVCRSAICATSGANQGKCVACVMDSQCTAAGTKCDTATNTCVSGCTVDSDCKSGTWCNETAHMCTAKIANGGSVPTDSAHTDPTIDGTCTKEAAAVVCQSGLCETSDDKCGLVDGDGPCSEDDDCRSGTCDTAKKVCGKPTTGCTSDKECPAADFCRDSDHTCTPKLPDGDKCSGSNECKNAYCANDVCSSVIATGNGLVCSTGPVGGETSGGAIGLLLAAAAVLRGRRRRASRS